MKYFHIDTNSLHRDNWNQFRTDEKYVVGDKLNPIYTNWKASATRTGGGITGEDVLRSISVMLRELAFENLRARVYSTLPSRTSCIWLCDSEESVRYWIERILHPGKKRILEIEILDGVTHKAYEEHLTNNLENIDELEARAHNYWLGHGTGNYEILFQGVMHIAREIYL